MHACACPRSGRTCSRHREGRSQSCTFFQRAGIVSSCFRLFSVIATPAHWRDRDRSSTAAGTAPRTLTGLARPAAPARRRVAKVSCRGGWRTSISRWLDAARRGTSHPPRARRDWSAEFPRQSPPCHLMHWIFDIPPGVCPAPFHHPNLRVTCLGLVLASCPSERRGHKDPVAPPLCPARAGHSRCDTWARNRPRATWSAEWLGPSCSSAY